MDKATRQRVFLIIILFALLAVLSLLIAGINSVHPLPGKQLPNPFADVPEEVSGASPSGPDWGAQVIRILIQSLFALGAAVMLLFLIISSKHRKQFAIIFAVLLIIALALSHIHKIPQGEQIAAQQDSMQLGIGEPPPVGQVHPEIPPVNPTSWQIILIAVGVSLVLIAIGLLFFLKIYPAIRSRHSNEEDFLGDLGRSAGLAAHRIIAGDDPRAAILRCYQEMTEIMSQAERIPNYSYFTPREFSAHLRMRGMKNEDVDRLTGIFETVRYGGRGGEAFIDEAVSCLQSIQETYEMEEKG
ncbi:DUF4129 domain-containing protein [Candidatus Bipolaricaulota bacterium]|nr:DUF4129 domain-containing protein [Candidatus Bipolaricaulota bacterium]